MKIDKMLKEVGLIGSLTKLPTDYFWHPRKLFLTQYYVIDLKEWRIIGSIKSIEVEPSFWPKSHVIVHGRATMYYETPTLGYSIPYVTEIKTEVESGITRLLWTQKIPLMEIYETHNDVNTRLIHTTFGFSLAEKFYIKLVKLYRRITKMEEERG